MSKKPKKVTAKPSRSQEHKFEGSIPENKILDGLTTTRAHSYMSKFYDYSDAVDFMSEYLPEKLAIKLRKMPKYSISQTAGWIAKYIKNGCTVMPESKAYLDKAVKIIEDYEFEEKISQSSVSIKNYENNQIISLETILDKILMGEAVNFKASDHFKINEPSAVDLKAIKQYYDGMADQLRDKKLKEYFNHSAQITKKLIDFYQDIVDTTDILLNNKVRERKPRKAKAKPVSKLVSKLRFAKEDSILKITSMAAERVVASDQLLIYNSKNKVLTMLFAKDGKKFSAHRTAITEIDETKSFQKTLRKPEVNIHKFTSGTKAAVLRAMKELTTVDKPVNSFFTNEHCLIVRAF